MNNNLDNWCSEIGRPHDMSVQLPKTKISAQSSLNTTADGKLSQVLKKQKPKRRLADYLNKSSQS